MFLHDYLLACEISTVRTQTLICAYQVSLKCWFNFKKAIKDKYIFT